MKFSIFNVNNNMIKKKVLLVFGTRPEAIKMAPIFHEFSNRPDIFEVRVCVTAQHREMLDQVLNFFNITPDYDLDIMSENQSLNGITSKIISGIETVYKSFSPDIVLVHGDTCTSTASALAAFYLDIKVGHVEAGLRTYNIESPWPEEAQRQMTAILSSYNFSPTSLSAKNLQNEGRKSIWITGNSVIDALNFTVKKIENDKSLKNKIISTISSEYKMKSSRKFILLTGHRRENFGKGFLNICESIKLIANKNPHIDIVYPVHLNPNVKEPVNKILGSIHNIYLLEPLSYEVFIYLMNKSYFIISDSGGIQEEAPTLGKPVLVMRDTTERPEAIEAGTAILVGTEVETITNSAQRLLDDQFAYEEISKIHNPYGDGSAAKKIADILEENLS